MTGKELVLSVSDFQQDKKYLFVRAHKSAADKISAEKFQADQAVIMRLTDAHVKKFGGNFLDIHDQKRGLTQAMKLINLGLEYVCQKKTGEAVSEDFDTELAMNIVSKASPSKLYEVGKKLFMERCEAIAKLLERTEIEIVKYYFRLINEEEYLTLKRELDLDLIQGLLKEYQVISNLMEAVEDKLMLLPFLPIHERTFFVFKSFGSLSKGTYPTKTGLIDCMLSSLLVACLFREERDLFQDRGDSDILKRFYQQVQDESLSEKTREYCVESLLKQTRVMEEDEKLRFGMREKWTRIFADMLNIKDAELEQFSDMLFFEPARFREEVERIEGLFIKFFDVYAKALRRKKPSGFKRVVKKLLIQTEKRIVREVTEFYKVAKDSEISREEVKKFWSARVILETGSEKERQEEIALRSEEGISPERLAEMSGEYIANATANFRVWPEEKKRAFIEKLNPNRFFLEKFQPTEDFVKFIRHISTEKMVMNYQEGVGEKKEVAVFQEAIDWTEKVLRKIGWEYLHPGVVAIIWEDGTSEARNALYALRERIKVSLPSFRGYYFKEQNDPRLFAYILNRLIREDKIKTKKMLKSLVDEAENIPVIRAILKTRYEEVKSDLK